MKVMVPSLRVLERRFEATFLERPNRYLGIVDLAGQRTQAFIPNPGRMKELMVPGRKVLIRPAPQDRPRKTAFDLVAVRHRRRFVLIDSGVPNRFLKYLLQNELLPELEGWNLEKAETTWGTSQFDFLLTRGQEKCLLEAKCCTLVIDGWARFPDAPTVRGTRHVRELTEARRNGYRAIIMLLVQGIGAKRFRPNGETDPAFAEALRVAVQNGVEVFARGVRFSGNRVYLGRNLPVVIPNGFP